MINFSLLKKIYYYRKSDSPLKIKCLVIPTKKTKRFSLEEHILIIIQIIYRQSSR